MRSPGNIWRLHNLTRHQLRSEDKRRQALDILMSVSDCIESHERSRAGCPSTTGESLEYATQGAQKVREWERCASPISGQAFRPALGRLQVCHRQPEAGGRPPPTRRLLPSVQVGPSLLRLPQQLWKDFQMIQNFLSDECHALAGKL